MSTLREDNGIRLLRERRGGRSYIRRRLGLSENAVYEWQRVPLEYVFRVAHLLRVPPEQLRPDFFCNDPLRAAAAKEILNAVTDR